MNAPQVSADDDIVIFGGEFEDEATSSTPKKVEKPAPKKELPPPPVEEPESPSKPEIVEPQDTPPTQPLEEPESPPKPEIVEPQDTPPTQPLDKPESPPKPEIIEPQDTPPTQPLDKPEPTQPAPIEQPTVEPSPLVETDQPFERPVGIYGGQETADDTTVIVPPRPEPTTATEQERRYFSSSNVAQPQSELKMLKPRFIKLAVDDTYTYYLDKSTVQWKRIPYLANEYMADVWIRMIERDPAPLDEDMSAYGADNFRAQIALAREQGYQYPPEDIKVLRSQAYVLEHYYLRPKTHQIQFLCELEVFGRPQNAINERAYDYKNWENLVPGSVESLIYDTTIKIIGKSKASERGHMTFIDMLEEYGRISLR